MPGTVDIQGLTRDPSFARLWVGMGAKNQAEKSVMRARAERILSEASRRNAAATQPTPSPMPGAAAPMTANPYTLPRPNMAMNTYIQKQKYTGEQVTNQAQDLLNFYNAKIKPKLDRGEIGSMGQGWAYLHPGLSTTKIDPDVEQFLTQTGPFSLAANAYYNQVGGSRGGISLLQAGTQPHVPHPPASAEEVLSTNWDLPKQAAQLKAIIDYINHQQSGAPPRTYGATPGAPVDPVDAAAAKYGL